MHLVLENESEEDLLLDNPISADPIVASFNDVVIIDGASERSSPINTATERQTLETSPVLPNDGSSIQDALTKLGGAEAQLNDVLGLAKKWGVNPFHYQEGIVPLAGYEEAVSNLRVAEEEERKKQAFLLSMN